MYLTEMKNLAKFFNISPDLLTKDNIYQYQEYLINEKQTGHSSMKIIINSLRFFYNKVMDYDRMIKYLPYQKKDQNYQPS
jgi:hypothetical protein